MPDIKPVWWVELSPSYVLSSAAEECIQQGRKVSRVHWYPDHSFFTVEVLIAADSERQAVARAIEHVEALLDQAGLDEGDWRGRAEPFDDRLHHWIDTAA